MIHLRNATNHVSLETAYESSKIEFSGAIKEAASKIKISGRENFGKVLNTISGKLAIGNTVSRHVYALVPTRLSESVSSGATGIYDAVSQIEKKKIELRSKKSKKTPPGTRSKQQWERSEGKK
jgi:hypothetical protein